jgi:hypothetical protein
MSMHMMPCSSFSASNTRGVIAGTKENSRRTTEIAKLPHCDRIDEIISHCNNEYKEEEDG